ncbi:MAG TPA: BON domain-containing protein [Blastocatellia bacterium]|nr:BON domain-containing protein [Blastocatellia bacterium]
MNGNNKIKTAIYFLTFSLLVIGSGCDTSTNNAGDNRPAVTNANRGKTPPRDIRREEVERDRGSWEQQARDLGRRIGNGADDLWIWVKTRSVLASMDELRDSTIDIDVENNVVTLGGTVPNESQKARAVELVRGIEGVSSVNDNLRVASTDAKTGTR